MASVTLYTINGIKKGELSLEDSIFAVKVNPALVHQAVVAQAANSRIAIAHTKTRGEVAGTGKKPWKQKGTGRARHGSRRSPIWSGGGITFGPRNDRNFSLKINQKARRKALAMVLSDKLALDRIIAIDQIPFEDLKTKDISSMLKKLPVVDKKTLIITVPENKVVSRAAKNIEGVSTLPANALNVIDLLRFDYVLIAESAIAMITELYKQK